MFLFAGCVSEYETGYDGYVDEVDYEAEYETYKKMQELEKEIDKHLEMERMKKEFLEDMDKMESCYVDKRIEEIEEELKRYGQ